MSQTTAILRNPSSGFGGNDACLASLVNLEISDESPPKYDIDIHLLLSDNEITSKEQCNDKDTKEFGIALHSFSGDTGVPTATKMAAAVVNNLSLGALAKNHLESNKRINDWCADGDFSFADLLCSDNGPTCFSNTRTQDAENLNFFDICTDPQEDKSGSKISTMPEEELSCDLSDLLLDSFGSVNFSVPNSTVVKSSGQNSSKDEGSQNVTDAFLSSLIKDDSDDFHPLDSFNDFLSEVSRNKAKNSTAIDVLSDLELSSSNTSEVGNEKQDTEETSDDEQVPDIDLNFCIKKNINEKCGIDSISPNSVDSGFIEMDSSQNFIFNIGDKNSLYSDANFFGKAEKIKCKQSLFSRALSAKPKVDKERVSKLRWVQREFFKKQVPSVGNDCKQSNLSNKIVDRSADCIITSNFQKISNRQLFA